MPARAIWLGVKRSKRRPRPSRGGNPPYCNSRPDRYQDASPRSKVEAKIDDSYHVARERRENRIWLTISDIINRTSLVRFLMSLALLSQVDFLR